MKRTIFRPGVFSIFMIALMMYLSCNKQNNTELVPLQKISASGENDSVNELKRPDEPVIKSNTHNPGIYTGNVLINNYQEKDSVVTDMNLGSGRIAFHNFSCDKTTAVIPDIAFFKSLSYDYTTFTSIKSTLN